MNNFLYKFTIGCLVFSLLIWNFPLNIVLAMEDTSTTTVVVIESNQDSSIDDDEVIENTAIIAEDNDVELSINEEQSEDDTVILIETGDSSVISDIENQVNINIDSVQSSDDDVEIDIDTGTSTEPTLAEEENVEEGVVESIEEDLGTEVATTTPTSTIEMILDIENDNEANIDNNVDGSTNSGSNIVVDNDGDVVIETGDNLLISNIFNLININIIGARAMTTAVNIVGNIIGDLDLSRYSTQELAEVVTADEVFQEFEQTQLQASINEESDDGTLTIDDSTTIRNSNKADVANEVNLQAISGNNSISNNGSVTVKTGDVLIASNVANIVNTTIVGDNFTLAIINIVGGDWDGNLILPSLTVDQLQDSSSVQSGCQSGCQDTADILNQLDNEEITVSELLVADSLEVTNNNDAEINNSVSIIADSGDNNITDNNGDIRVETGEVVTMSQVLNFVNTNILGNGRIFGIINMMNAKWNGNIWGVPDDGFVVDRQGSYITFYNSPEVLTVYSDEFDGSNIDDVSDDATTEGDNLLLLSSTDSIVTDNTAVINNNVVIDASSGENGIIDNNGDVNIETGNVAALSNIFNLANTNVTGDNTTFAVINILGGEWNGDINFGMPDLQLIEVSQADPDPAVPSGFIDYTLIVTNKGDAPATNVSITAVTNPSMVDVVKYDGGELDDFGVVTWIIPELGIGEIKTFYYRARILETAANNDVVANHAKVSSDQDDRNYDDNQASTEVYILGNSGPKISGIGVPVIFAANAGSPQGDARSDEAFQNPVVSDALQIIQSNDSQGLIRGGQTVSFTLDVTNTTDESLYDVMVWGEIKGPGGVLSVDSWELGEVFPRENITIKYSINFIEDALPGTYTNSVWGDGFDKNSQFLVFSETRDVLVIREGLDPDTINTGLEMTYYDKYVGFTEEDSISIVNNGSTGISNGVLIVRYEPEYLLYNNDMRGSFAVDVPSLQPGESYNIDLAVLPLKNVERTQIDLEYVLEGVSVSNLTIFQDILKASELTATIVTTDNSNKTPVVNLIQTNEVDNVPVENNSDILEPKVLGYEAVFDNSQNKNASAFINGMFKYGWLVGWVIVLLLLFFWKKKEAV